MVNLTSWSVQELIDWGIPRVRSSRASKGALKQPIKQPTETPTSTLALMGRFPALMGRLPTLMGRFADFVLRGRFTSWQSTGKQAFLKKRGIKRFLISLKFSTNRFVRMDSRESPWFALRIAGPSKPPNIACASQESRAAKRGWFQTGGFPDLDLSFFFCPFLSFLGLSRFFWDFPDLLGDGPGIFPICPFLLSRPIKSTYEEQSRKGPRHNLDLSRKKWETPQFGNPLV